MTSILVSGPSHSGVEQMYTVLKASLPRGLTVFGPRQPQQFEFIRSQPHVWKLVATTGRTDSVIAGAVDMFDLVVVTRRDPRDRLLAAVLSEACRAGITRRDTVVAEVGAMLRAKERSPGAVSIGSLVDALLVEMPVGERDRHMTHSDDALALADGAGTAVNVVDYDDLVAARVEDLERSLSVRLRGGQLVPDHLTVLDREPEPGAWRRWFTAEDVDRYRPLLADQLVTAGFSRDWELASPQLIDPSESSLNVERSVQRARSRPNQFDTLRAPDHYTPDFVDHLRAAIQDGDEGAMIEYALAHLVGYIAPASRDEYLRWIHAARRRRNPSALMHWGVALQRLVASDRTHGPSHYFEEAASIIGNAAAKRRIQHIRSLYEAHRVGTSAP